MPPARQDPFAGCNFRVELDGIPVARFTECHGLSSETAVIRYREGGDAHVRLIPGLTTYSPITLKRGITGDRSLWEWRQHVVEGQLDRRSGSIILMTADGKDVARWNFENGWPSRWEGPALNGLSHDVAIETLEVVHEGLDWVA